jgi:flavin reductase (DIM6/NTAB) family NADH-FMN oxidoreductase RutF
VLAAHQEAVARYFADRNRAKGPGEFAPVQWTSGPYTGAPLIGGALAWFECALRQAHGGGDHSIFLGRLISARCRDTGQPVGAADDGPWSSSAAGSAGSRTSREPAGSASTVAC